MATFEDAKRGIAVLKGAEKTLERDIAKRGVKPNPVHPTGAPGDVSAAAGLGNAALGHLERVEQSANLGWTAITIGSIGGAIAGFGKSLQDRAMYGDKSIFTGPSKFLGNALSGLGNIVSAPYTWMSETKLGHAASGTVEQVSGILPKRVQDPLKEVAGRLNAAETNIGARFVDMAKGSADKAQAWVNGPSKLARPLRDISQNISAKHTKQAGDLLRGMQDLQAGAQAVLTNKGAHDALNAVQQYADATDLVNGTRLALEMATKQQNAAKEALKLANDPAAKKAAEEALKAAEGAVKYTSQELGLATKALNGMQDAALKALSAKELNSDAVKALHGAVKSGNMDAINRAYNGYGELLAKFDGTKLKPLLDQTLQAGSLDPAKKLGDALNSLGALDNAHAQLTGREADALRKALESAEGLNVFQRVWNRVSGIFGKAKPSQFQDIKELLAKGEVDAAKEALGKLTNADAVTKLFDANMLKGRVDLQNVLDAVEGLNSSHLMVDGKKVLKSHSEIEKLVGEVKNLSAQVTKGDTAAQAQFLDKVKELRAVLGDEVKAMPDSAARAAGGDFVARSTAVLEQRGLADIKGRIEAIPERIGNLNLVDTSIRVGAVAGSGAIAIRNAKNYGNGVDTLKQILGDLTGRDPKEISNREVLFSGKVPPIVANARKYLNISSGMGAMVDAANMFTSLKMAFSKGGLNRNHMIAVGAMSALSMFGKQQILDRIAGGDVLTAYADMGRKISKGEPLVADDVYNLMAACSPEVRREGKSVLVQEVCQRYLNDKATPAKILRDISDGTLSKRWAETGAELKAFFKAQQEAANQKKAEEQAKETAKEVKQELPQTEAVEPNMEWTSRPDIAAKKHGSHREGALASVNTSQTPGIG